MAVENAPRAVREIWPTAGVGGFMEILWRRTNPTPPQPFDSMSRVEVGLWEIQFRYRNIELPESGGGGAMGVYRAAESFRFRAEVILDFAHERQGAPPVTVTGQTANHTVPFIEEIFRGRGDTPGEGDDVPPFYRVATKFQLGDPSRAPDNLGSFYFCPGAMIEEIIPSNPSRPPFDVARAIVKGVGAEPMERWVGTTRVSNRVFDWVEPQ